MEQATDIPSESLGGERYSEYLLCLPQLLACLHTRLQQQQTLAAGL